MRIASTDFPGIDETLPVIAVVADQQCPKAHARPLWIGEPPDDEFLPPNTLDLYPPGAPLPDVRTVEMLADDPFTPLTACLPPEGFASFRPVRSPAYMMRPVNGLS